MKIDYHMHFEYGSYDEEWVKGFFEAAKARGIEELGITEHSHTFREFEELYYEDLILDDSFIGDFQKKWLKKNKFKYDMKDYFDFMANLKLKYPVKIAIEVCNFKNQEKVAKILKNWDFDYIIGSVHFLDGWAYDSSEIKAEWENRDLREIYEIYVKEVENLAASGLYDVLGHPFNIRLFKHIPDFDTEPYLKRVATALKKADMAVDVNTGTFYRYPIEEISPYPDFMKVAREADLPIITSSDAHKPEDAGRFIKEAEEYAKSFGYTKIATFDGRKRTLRPIG
ncbi:MAG: histidinol-phosphatase [Selenomonadaceae bacterium]|nr:histidinol-phosphatase [Selenomonadaceae bacterium]